MSEHKDIVSFANSITMEKFMALPSDYHRHIVSAYCQNAFRQSLPGNIPVNALNISKASVLLKLGEIGVMALANKDFEEGEEIFSLCGPMTSKPNIFTVQVDHEMHMIPSGGGAEYLAHSCQPSVKLVIEKHDVKGAPKVETLPFDAANSLPDLIENRAFPAWWNQADGAGHIDAQHDEEPYKFQEEYTMHVVALHKIKVGDVLCFNYLTTEYAMDQRFPCMCSKISAPKSENSVLPVCFGTIQGYKYLTPELKEALKPLCTSVVLESEAAANSN